MEWNFNGMVARKAEPEPCTVSPCAIKRVEDGSFYSTRLRCSCAAFVSLGGKAAQTQSCRSLEKKGQALMKLKRLAGVGFGSGYSTVVVLLCI